MNIIQIFERFPDQEACIAHLERARWNDVPKCPYCGSEYTYPIRSELRHHCNDCRKSFSVTVGTIFHHTHLPLQKWFLAISLILNAKKGIASRQLARDLELPVKTAWFLNMRIRQAMLADSDFLKGIIQMDETYIGGKPRPKNEHSDDEQHPRGRGTSKLPVVGMIERHGKVKAECAKDLKAISLMNLVRKNVDADNSILITDEFPGYIHMASIIDHYVVNHSQRYSDGKVNTNCIESFWSLLKRGIVGQYHRVSGKYLPVYVNEFCYRFNARFESNDVLFNRTIHRLLLMNHSR